MRDGADVRRRVGRRQPDAGLAQQPRAPRRAAGRGARCRSGRSSSRRGRARPGRRPRASPRQGGGRARGRARAARRGGRGRRARRRRSSRPAAWRRRRGTSAARRLSIRSAGPASTAPSGQPSPFERQSVTVSTREPIAGGRHAEGDGGVHQPRAVHVDADARGPRHGDDRVELVERPHAAAGDVVRVLDARARPGAGRRRPPRSRSPPAPGPA